AAELHLNKEATSQQRTIQNMQSDAFAKTPDTVYIYQDDSGYRTSVSAGLNPDKIQFEESRNSRTDRKEQTNQRREEKENIRVLQTPPQVIYLDQDRQRHAQPVIIYRD